MPRFQAARSSTCLLTGMLRQPSGCGSILCPQTLLSGLGGCCIWQSPPSYRIMLNNATLLSKRFSRACC
jgi:hypothetical protein